MRVESDPPLVRVAKEGASGRETAPADMLFVLAAATAAHLIGWTSGPAAAQELVWEKSFAAVPSAANAAAIEQRLSSRPHRAGTPADYATALFVQQRLQADGFTTRIVPYDVQFTAPIRQSLAIVSPVPVQFDLLEGTPGHHTPQEIAAGPPFAGSSGDGDVTGPLYYVNYGSAADLQALDALHIDLHGAIALLRANGGASYAELKKRGVIGIVEFTDPADDGFGRGQTWPHGNYKNMDMAERAGAPAPSAATPLPPGDTTLPGQAPLPGIAHNAWNSVPRPDIPELPVTQRTARSLLAALSGPIAAPEWHPLFELPIHTGGNVRVHLVVQMQRKIVRIWNVIGDIRGSELPDSIVMIGSHRDAMAFGAIDPGSGTTVLMQDADGFHKLLQQGWRPKRTIELASWDGHELGLFGSISYAYQFGPQLRASMDEYINTDQVTTGSPFLIRASPVLWAYIKQVADEVPGPDGSMLGSGTGTTTANPLLQPPSSGSDQQTFAYQLGVPSSSNGFRGPFGAHHTAEDTIPGIAVYDPGFKEAVADAILTGIQAMRAASATVPPWRISDHAQNLLTALKLDAQLIKPGVDGTALQSALTDYVAAAQAVDAQLDSAEAAGDTASAQALSAKQHAALSAFYAEGGLSNYRYYHSIDRAPFAFPEVINAASSIDQQAAVDRFVAVVRQATAALR